MLQLINQKSENEYEKEREKRYRGKEIGNLLLYVLLFYYFLVLSCMFSQQPNRNIREGERVTLARLTQKKRGFLVLETWMRFFLLDESVMLRLFTASVIPSILSLSLSGFVWIFQLSRERKTLTLTPNTNSNSLALSLSLSLSLLLYR